MPRFQGVISRVTAQYDRWVHMQSNEPLIVKLQANWKGYLARKAYKERRTFIKEHLPAIIKIQVGSLKILYPYSHCVILCGCGTWSRLQKRPPLENFS